MASAAGLRCHHHQPEHAWRRLHALAAEQIPAALTEAVRRVLALARER